jgi:tetratricopeptide (TPR) repeat protein
LEPDNPDFLANLANALDLLGELEAALACYRKALALNPGSRETSGSIGSLLLAMGKLEEGLVMERQGFGVVKFDLERGVSIKNGAYSVDHP